MKEFNIYVSAKFAESDKIIIQNKQNIFLTDLLERIKNLEGIDKKIYETILKRIKKTAFRIEDSAAYTARMSQREDYNRTYVPTGFYSIAENTVYMRGDSYLSSKLAEDELSLQTRRIAIQETLYSMSSNCRDKSGLMTIHEEDKKTEIIGQGFNRAATIDITNKIIGDSVVNGVPQDYVAALESVKAILEMSEEEYMNMYFIDKKWYTEDLETRFNPQTKDELIKLIKQYDERKKLSKFFVNDVAEILYSAFYENLKRKIKAKEEIDKYEERFTEAMVKYTDYFDLLDAKKAVEQLMQKANKK
ncbi:MAG: hypothetical protein RSB87_05365 [Clostridia bacterium]